MSYTAQEIAKVVHATLHGHPDRIIRNIAIDSRTLAAPGTSMFIAIKGERHDGHQFIHDLFQRGVRCFLTETSFQDFQMDATYLVVPDSLKALQQLAAYHRKQFSIPVIGITGSNGKTILKEWIYQSLHNEKDIVRSPRSFNSQVGVPLSAWLMEEHHQLAILEAGISRKEEMQHLEHIIRPDIGIFTNIGAPHQENFTDLAEKASEKMKLFTHSSSLIYCKDHVLIDQLVQSPTYAHLKRVDWSFHQPAFLQVGRLLRGEHQTQISGSCQQTPFSYTLPFIDGASIENALHLITLLHFLGYQPEFIHQRLKALSPVAMRLELKQGINQCTLINDSYNSDLGSLSIALDFLGNQRQHPKKTVILSDILQSGHSGEALYQEVANLVTQKKVDHFVGIGKELLRYRKLFPMENQFYETTADFLMHLRRGSFTNEAVLIKGSRTFEFEKIVTSLEDKAHETVLEINLNAMIHNLNYFKSYLKPETKLVAMVKAFSYGSGSHEIANLLQFHRVDYLAVAFADEGVALREAGITMPILVMNPEKHSFAQIIKYSLEPEIYSFRVLHDFMQAVEAEGAGDFPVHIKLDTGMHRLGFLPKETDQLIDEIKRQRILKVSSVFSHLAGSDEEGLDYFTKDQLDVFETNSTKIINAFPHKIIRHILNSAGIERFPEYQYDMVRLGIGLYGISARDNGLLKQVSRLKTVILQVKDIPAHDTVGYGRKHKAQQNMRIAILPIGYADGLHRLLGNGAGKFWVNGQKADIIGNICMDMCMIDITNIQANEGDEVIVFGDEYPITEIAAQMKTIPYEVFTSISRRVKRIYYQE